jgi:hypothetical protein
VVPPQTGGSAASSSHEEDGAAVDEDGGGVVTDTMRRLMEMTNLPESYARALLEAHNGDLEAVVAQIMVD